MNKLEWQVPEGKTLAVDIYKTKEPYNIKKNYVPLVSNYTETFYEDHDALPNETNYYTLGYYNEDGVYITTQSRRVNSTFKDVHIDNVVLFIINDVSKIDHDPRLCFHNNYKSLVNDFGCITSGNPRTFYSRFSNDEGIMYFAGNNTTSNNSENGRLSCNLSTALGTADFTIELFGCFPINENTTISGANYIDIGRSGIAGSISFSNNGLANNPSLFTATGTSTNFTSVLKSTITHNGKNKYDHYCLMRKNGVFYIFVNGALGGTHTNTTYNIAPLNVYIGANGVNTTSITGYIDSIRITKSAIYNIEGFDEPSEAFSESVDESVLLLLKVKDGVAKDCSTYNLPITQTGAPKNYRVIHSFLYNQPSILFKDLSDKIYTTSKMIGYSDFTFECKIKPDLLNCPAMSPLISIGPNGGTALLYINGTASSLTGRHIVFWSSDDNISYYNSNYTLTHDEWYHVCVMRKDNTIAVFLNGEITYSVENTYKSYIAGNVITLGCRDNTTSGYVGYMTDIRITKSARYNMQGFIPEKRLRRDNIYKNINFDITANDSLRLSFETTEDDVTYNVHKSENEVYDENTIIVDNLEEKYYIDSTTKLNSEYYFAVSSNLPNRGIYNFSKMKYYFEKDSDRFHDHVSAKFLPNLDKPSSFTSELYNGVTLPSYGLSVIDPTKMRNFCYAYGANTTANNTVNTNISIPIANPDLTDWCIECRCLFPNDMSSYNSFIKIWNMGVAQTVASSTQTGIWLRFDNSNILGLGLYRGTTALSLAFNNFDLSIRKPYDICIERKNGIFYAYLDGVLKHTISNCTDLSILAPTLSFFGDSTKLGTCPGYYTNIRYTKAARYNGENYTPLDILPTGNEDPLWDKVNLLLDFNNEDRNNNNAIDKSSVNSVITQQSVVLYKTPDEINSYYLFNGYNTYARSIDAYITNFDYTVETEFYPLYQADTTWRTVFSLGKYSIEGFVKVAFNGSNTLLFQLYRNGYYVKMGQINLNDDFYNFHKIAISKTGNTIRCYYNKKLVGIYEHDGGSNIVTTPGFYVGQHSSNEFFRGFIKNLRITTIGRYTEDIYYDDNFEFDHSLGKINSATGFYNGESNVLQFDTIGSFDHYDIRRIDRLQHKLLGTVISSGRYNKNIEFYDDNVEINKSYGYILTLYGGDKIVESNIVNVYTSTIKDRHISNFTVDYDKYNVNLNWETDDVLGFYYIYKTENPNIARLDKTNKIEVTSVTNYVDPLVQANKTFYYFIEHYQNNELIGFGSTGPIETDLKGVLAVNITGLHSSAGANYGLAYSLKENTIFYDKYFHQYHKKSKFETFGQAVHAAAGNYYSNVAGSKYFDFNVFGVDINIVSQTWVYSGTYNDAILTFEDNAGNVYACVKMTIDGSLGSALYYGKTVATATTKAGKSTSSVAIGGYIRVTPTSLAFFNTRTSDYVNGFIMNDPDMSKITRLKISGLNARFSYSNSSYNTYSYAQVYIE